MALWMLVLVVAVVIPVLVLVLVWVFYGGGGFRGPRVSGRHWPRSKSVQGQGITSGVGPASGEDF